LDVVFVVKKTSSLASTTRALFSGRATYRKKKPNVNDPPAAGAP